MKRLLIFSGTTEGRRLAQAMAGKYEITVSVATDYGRELAEGGQIVCGRMDREQMALFMKERQIDIAADATHPYAREATENIRQAAAQAGTAYLRVLRQAGDAEGLTVVQDAQQAAALLEEREGNVLLAIGSKDLDAFTRVKGYAERMYPRVLPVVSSLERCAGLGYETARIVAMQGPFSEKLNRAIMEQFAINIMVTKDSGPEGGMAEKVSAAKALGIQVILLARPEDQGMRLEEAISYLEENR